MIFRPRFTTALTTPMRIGIKVVPYPAMIGFVVVIILQAALAIVSRIFPGTVPRVLPTTTLIAILIVTKILGATLILISRTTSRFVCMFVLVMDTSGAWPFAALVWRVFKARPTCIAAISAFIIPIAIFSIVVTSITVAIGNMASLCLLSRRLSRLILLI